MAVVAQIRRDEGVVSCRSRALQILRQGIQIDDVRIATGRVVDDRMEVDEGVVFGRVLVRGGRNQCFVRLADSRMPAGGALPPRVLAHVLHVTLPCMAGRLQLIR